MKKNRVAGLAIVLVAAIVLFGCSTGAGAPSTAEVKNAFLAMNTAQSSAPAANSATYVIVGGVYTYSPIPISNPNGGSMTLVYTSSSNPSAGPSTVTGTLTITNWVDLSTGYTINGIVSLSETISDPTVFPIIITATVTGNFTLTGGTISTLACNIHESVSIPISLVPTVTLTGTVTANGFQYNVTSLM